MNAHAITCRNGRASCVVTAFSSLLAAVALVVTGLWPFAFVAAAVAVGSLYMARLWHGSLKAALTPRKVTLDLRLSSEHQR